MSKIKPTYQQLEKKVQELEKELAGSRSGVKSKIMADMLDIAPSSITVHDFQGNFLYANKKTFEIHGYNEKEFMVLNLRDIDTPESAARINERMKLVSKKGEASFDVLHFRKDRSVILLEVYVTKVNWQGFPALLSIATDITERRKNEELLKLSEEKFEKAFKNSFVIMAINTIDTGIYMDVNDAFLSTLEYSREEVIGKSSKDLQIFVHKKKRDTIIRSFIDKGYARNIEVKLRSKSGKVLTGLLALNIISLKQGKFLLTQMIDITAMKQAEASLQASEEKFKNIVNASPMGMHMYELRKKDDLVFTGANPAADQILGVDHAIFIGKTIEEAFPGFVQTEVPAKYREAAQNGTIWRTEQINYNEGAIRGAFEVVAFQIEPGKMVALFSEITLRKQVEEALQESEMQFRNLFENAPVGIGVTDLQGNILIFNDAMMKPGEYTREEIFKIGSVEALYFDPDQRKEILALFNKQGYLHNYELKFRKKDGSAYNALMSISRTKFNKQSCFQAIVEDITERKKAEEILMKERSLLRTLIDNLPSGVFVKDKDFKKVLVNPIHTESVLGHLKYLERESNIDILGVTDFEVFPKELAEKFFADDRKVVMEGLSIINKLEFGVSPEGKKIWLLVSKVPLLDKDGSIIGMIGITNDITTQKEVEEELIKAKEKAEESDRLKTAFLQNMSHEIRTPMNAITGFSDLLNNPDLSAEKRKSFTTIIMNSSNQLLSIVNDILTISSIDTHQEKVNLESVCLNSIIVDLLAIFKQRAFNQNISIYSKYSLSDRQSEIYTDRTKLTQVLSNLLTNALKFTHEGFIEFGYRLKNEELEFYVKDSGIGIKNDMLDKIFERFRQANLIINKKYGGTGLGLAISKAFVELMGGKIWVESEVDEGSTFYFTLPYTPVSVVKNSDITPQKIEKTVTILIAEDEEYNFLYLEELLHELNVTIIHTKDGKETIETCKLNPEIGLILMDIKLPIMEGHIAAAKIKEFRPELPIIAQSAYVLEHEIRKYEGAGFDDYITKPIKKDELLKKIIKYIK